MKRRLEDALRDIPVDPDTTRTEADILRAEIEGTSMGLEEGQNVVHYPEIQKRPHVLRSDGRMWTTADKADPELRKKFERQEEQLRWVREASTREQIMAHHPDYRFLAMYAMRTGKRTSEFFKTADIDRIIHRENEARRARELEQRRRIVPVDQKAKQLEEINKLIIAGRTRIAEYKGPMEDVNPDQPELRDFFDMHIKPDSTGDVEKLARLLERADFMEFASRIATDKHVITPADAQRLREYGPRFYGAHWTDTHATSTDVPFLRELFLAGFLLYFADRRRPVLSNRELAKHHFHKAMQNVFIGRRRVTDQNMPVVEAPGMAELRALLAFPDSLVNWKVSKNSETVMRKAFLEGLKLDTEMGPLDSYHEKLAAHFASLNNPSLVFGSGDMSATESESRNHYMAMNNLLALLGENENNEMDMPFLISVIYAHQSEVVLKKSSLTGVVGMLTKKDALRKRIMAKDQEGNALRSIVAAVSVELLLRENKDFVAAFGWVSSATLSALEAVVGVSLSMYLNQCRVYLDLRRVLVLGMEYALHLSGTGVGTIAASEKSAGSWDFIPWQFYTEIIGASMRDMKNDVAKLQNDLVGQNTFTNFDTSRGELFYGRMRAALLHYFAHLLYRKDRDELQNLVDAHAQLIQDRDKLREIIGAVAAERPVPSRPADERMEDRNYEETEEWMQRPLVSGISIVDPDVIASIDTARTELYFHIPSLSGIPLRTLTSEFDSGLASLFAEWISLQKLKVELGFSSQLNRVQVYKEYKQRFQAICQRLHRYSYSVSGSRVTVMQNGQTMARSYGSNASPADHETTFLF